MVDAKVLRPDSVVQLSPFYLLRWEETQNAYVLLYPEGVVKLNGTSGEIMRLVTESATVQDIVDQLTTKYADQSIAPDILEFLEVSHANSWIRVKP